MYSFADQSAASGEGKVKLQLQLKEFVGSSRSLQITIFLRCWAEIILMIDLVFKFICDYYHVLLLN